MWYLYILLCDNKTFYIDITNHLQARIKEHGDGRSFFTKKFKDVELVHQEWHPTKTSAEKRKEQIEGWNNDQKLELIKKG
ncbi:GIY-YIG nuclease family protein [Patescibacteria group bacterium]|nr:GIY-YIG nuclease family protein [Patescibacteria group bacterium]